MFITHLGREWGAGLLGRSDMERNALAALVVAQNEIHGGQSRADGLLLQCSCCRAGCQSQTRPAALPLALNMAPPPKPPKSGINIDGEKERCPHHHFVWVDPIEGGPARSLDVAECGGSAPAAAFCPLSSLGCGSRPGYCAFGLRHLYANYFAEKFQRLLRSCLPWLTEPGFLGSCLWRAQPLPLERGQLSATRG